MWSKSECARQTAAAAALLLLLSNIVMAGVATDEPTGVRQTYTNIASCFTTTPVAGVLQNLPVQVGPHVLLVDLKPVMPGSL